MRIIKEGKIKEDEFHITCRKCDTIFAYREFEVKNNHYVGSEDHINCSLCTAYNSHSESELIKKD